MIIGHFQSGYPKPDGITSGVQGFSEAMVKQGHQVVVYGYGRSPHAKVKEIPGLRTMHFDSASHPFSASKLLLERLKVNADKLDILIIHGMFIPHNIAVSRYALKGRIPYVVCPHCPYDPVLLGKHWIRKSIYKLLFEKPLLQRASAVHVFSPKHAALLRDYGITSPALIVPNGLDPIDAPPVQSDLPEPLSGDPKILFLGRMDSYHKGLDLLLRGLGQALRSGRIPPSTVLTFVGRDAGDGEALRNLAVKENIVSQVVFAGAVTDLERWRMLQSCDLFVHSSRYDGFALAITEAMMMGKPLLLSVETANSHWIRDAACGFFIEPSVESICGGLIQAVEKRHEWVEMGQRAKEFASEKLTWDRAAAIAAENYANVLEGVHRGRLSYSFAGGAD